MVRTQFAPSFGLMPAGRGIALAGMLLLALPLAACAAQMPILPEGQIQLQSGTREVAVAQDPTAQTPIDPSEEATLHLNLPPGQAETDFPAIRPGSPDFHASQPDEFVLASGRVQLVEFFAYWCAVCKAVAPTVHGLENLYGQQVNFVYLDRDDPRTVAIQGQLGYTYQPHFFLIDPSGTVLAQWRGYIDGPELQQALVNAINE